MKKILFFLLIILVNINLSAGKENCFTIIAGRETTTDGSVMIAHNEDNSDKNVFLNIHKVPGQEHGENQLIKLKHHHTIPQVSRTYAFLWLQMPASDFCDSYFNENGVAITANRCPSKEVKGDLKNGGIGFMLRRILAEQAQSARQAVQIAGRLLTDIGYYDTGRTLCIADKKEGWLLHIVKGKHWLARRVPDNHIAVIPNYYTIGKINLADRKNFLGSADIIRYAILKGWYHPEKNEKFDFAKVYSAPEHLNSMRNILRHWRAIQLLSKTKYEIDARLPFSFIPKRKINLSDLFRILRDHYENSDHDLTDDYKKGSPNFTENRTICFHTTRYSFVASLRSQLPAEMAHVAWIAVSRPDSNAYSPWYFSLNTSPDGYFLGDAAAALPTHFNNPEKNFLPNPGLAYWSYAELSNLVDKDYKRRQKITQNDWKNFENYTQKNLRKKEREFQYLLKRDKNIALKIMTNYIHNLEYRKWFMARELIKKIKK